MSLCTPSVIVAEVGGESLFLLTLTDVIQLVPVHLSEANTAVSLLPYHQYPLHTFPRNFHIGGEVAVLLWTC